MLSAGVIARIVSTRAVFYPKTVRATAIDTLMSLLEYYREQSIAAVAAGQSIVKSASGRHLLNSNVVIWFRCSKKVARKQ